MQVQQLRDCYKKEQHYGCFIIYSVSENDRYRYVRTMGLPGYLKKEDLET